ncbi:MAG TPA: hypothetical protein VFE16_07265 [Candidatus Cybelea sp.]|nr:hypothetical protein [Candidatus Cybelea sp.]
MRLHRTLATALLFALLAAARAWAGPPLICHAIPIGSERSLPWIDVGSWNGADPSYDVARLERETLALLVPGAPVDLRRETLRRAAIYSARESGLGDSILVALMARVMNAQAGTNADPSAWFDAGYFAETLQQAARIYPLLHGSERDAWMIRSGARNVDGLAWMQTALRLGFKDYGSISTIRPE